MSAASPSGNAIEAEIEAEAAAPLRAPAFRAEDVPAWRRIGAFTFLLFADFFYGWAWNTVDVLRPYVKSSLGITLGEAGALYSAQGAGALIGAVVIGQAADRIGRRNVLFGIMLGYSLSLIAASWAGSYSQALASRFSIGLFLGGIFPTVVGLYTCLFDRRVCGRLASFYNCTFYGSVVVLGGVVGAMSGEAWRTILWIGGIPPLIAAPLIFLIVPNDLHMIPHGGAGRIAPRGKLPIVELFHNGLWRRTLRIATMIGMNFFAYQAFSGWMTTYLADVRRLPASEVGALVSWQFAGSILGGFFWGWLADRFGRRVNAVGFLLGAAAIVAFLTVPDSSILLRGLGLAYGFTLAASVIWGPWMAELYPVHLRSTAASIFNWGRIISFFAPLITAAVANSFGLISGMMLAAASFGVAAIIWLSLPETLNRRSAN